MIRKTIQLFSLSGLLIIMSCNDTNINNTHTTLELDTSKHASNTKEAIKVWSDTIDKCITWEVMSKYDQLPQLELKEISKSEYLKYKSAYHPTFIKDNSKLVQTDSSFIIQTSKSRLKYSKEYNKNYGNRSDFSWVDYKGYIKPLHLYVMESWGAGEFTIGDLFLVDSITNISYFPKSIADEPFEILMLSPDYAHIAIGLNTSIEIGKLTNINGILSYNEIAYGYIGWNFEEVLWIDDTKLVMKLHKLQYNEISKINKDTNSYVIAFIPLK